MISYQEALQIVLDSIRALPPVELPLSQAVGRVLAQPVTARWDLPPADNSAMDGYALSSEGNLSRLTLVGAAFAGHPSDRVVGPGEATKITTGAPLPKGADAVVPLEETRLEGEMLLLEKQVRKGQHVRPRGEEYHSGERLLEPGICLKAGEIGLLASAGIVRVRVYPKPRVAILSTGDELVELGEMPGPGQIVNSNLHLLAARLREIDCDPIPIGIGRDTPEAIAEGLRSGLKADLLLTTGGVSVGERDHVQESLQALGFEKKFWKVAIKPGKPILFGMVGEVPVFGLPGNPAASAATFDLFAHPALRRLAGHRQPGPPQVAVTLAEPVRADAKRQIFIWGYLEISESEFLFRPSRRQGSGQNRSLQGANALLPVDAGAGELPAGSRLKAIPLYLSPM